jgi:NADP-dependent 3-hydroxy acid dehydrogenase YdfG
MIDFNRRVLFLTGAAGSIGSAIAHSFYHCGARLFLIDT